MKTGFYETQAPLSVVTGADAGRRPHDLRPGAGESGQGRRQETHPVALPHRAMHHGRARQERRRREDPRSADTFVRVCPSNLGNARTKLSALWLVAALTVTFPADGAELKSPTLALTLRDGVIVRLANRLSGESLVAEPASVSLPAGLHRMNEPLLRVTNTVEVTTRQKFTQSISWSNLGRCELCAEIEPATGDLLLTQSGESTLKKLSGISWGIADIPDHFEVLVPGCGGQRFSDKAPAGRREFNYPMKWEASFVLIQGRAGGFLIRADDDPPRYKDLVVEHARHAFRLRFESRNLAPFENRDRIESCRWRLTAYRGSWRTGAAIYRRWAGAHHHRVPLSRQQPAWAQAIRFVVTIGSNAPLLSELARRCHPAQTLLYVPWWRRDGYDRNYPDYTAATNFDAFVSEAHRLGFRVMAHVNYFGCHPENPVYARVSQAHLRDPFTGKLRWWEWPARPPIKFAYINPASRLWRELFVERMRELVRRHNVDALHLDQTLCIYNDANGLVDGLTCLQGNLALHRELRAALPHVALSGEGLNEITGQYEAFAQRHVWSMDHLHGTWDDRLIAMSHPVSSAVLTPYTQIYGYLGMANPANATAYVAWRRAYEPFGVLPTYRRPDAVQLADPPPYVAEVLAHARFCQQHLPVPDFDTEWGREDLFVYRLTDGGRASFRRDNGVAFVHSRRREEAQTEKSPIANRQSPMETLSRRIEGVNVAKVDGSVAGWPAYDAKRLFGLNPKQAYPWSKASRDLSSLHVSALPDGVVLEQAGIHARFARFRFRNLRDAGRILLWDFKGEVVPGVRFPDGTTRHGDALDFEDELSAGMVHPLGEGLSFHPPWRGRLREGRPVTFIEFPLRLPKAATIVFESGVCLREAAVGKSDGVTFRVLAMQGDKTLSSEAHHDGPEARPLRLDLTPFAGAAVRLRLEVDAGPKSDPTYDWALMVAPQVAIENPAAPSARTIRLAGLKSVSTAFMGTNPVPLRVKADRTAKCSMPIPGTLILAFAEPPPVSIPCNLLQLKSDHHIVHGEGIERPAPNDVGSVTSATCGGVARRALNLQPRPSGRALADWLLRLPDTPVKLATAIGVRDGSSSSSVRFEVHVNGETQWSRSLVSGSGWWPVELDLAPWRGQPVLLTLATEAAGILGRDQAAVWATPRLTDPGALAE